MDVFYQTLQAVLRILYLYRSFLLVFIAAAALLLFLFLRKRHGRLFAGIMLGIMSLSIAFLLLGCYNAFLRPSYQKQPVTQEQLENLCKKLENGTYDAYQCFQEGTSLNLPKDELDPVHFTTKVVTLKKGFPKVTGLYAMLDISIWELESEGDAIKKYEAFLTNYWTNPFESKEESRQEIMEKGYLEIENQRYRAFIGPIEFSANFFEPTKGDSVRRLYRVTVQYGPMLVQISERTEMGGVKLICRISSYRIACLTPILKLNKRRALAGVAGAFFGSALT